MANTSKPFHEAFAEKVIESLEQGVAPWQKPWKAGMYAVPFNPISGTEYRGVNRVMLEMEGHHDPRFLTLKQANSQGWRVRKGEKSRKVVFWQFTKRVPQVDENGAPVLDGDGRQVTHECELTRPLLRYANVFHASQIEGIPDFTPNSPGWDDYTRDRWPETHPSERCEEILVNSGAVILHDQRDRAFYRSGSDEIHLPPKENFHTSDGYYVTALHELGHWTGAPERMGRESGPFGSEAYAREELRAEIASWMVGLEIGIGHDPGQHTAYVASWIQALKKDPYEIVRACRDAERIRGVILGFGQTQDKAQEQEVEREMANHNVSHTQKQAPTMDASTLSPEVPEVLYGPAAEGPLPEPPSGFEWEAHYTGEEIIQVLVPASDPAQRVATDTAVSKTYLNVPYAEKDLARQAGARWDRQEKLWFAPTGSTLSAFERWLPTPGQELEKPVHALSPEAEFAEVLRQVGIDLKGQLPIMDGAIHRVGTFDRPNSSNGVYLGHADGRPNGWAQNFRTGERLEWVATGCQLSQEQLNTMRAKAAQEREQAQALRQQQREQAAKRAFGIWKNAPAWASSDHPYLAAKQVHGYGVKVGDNGALLIPGRDVEGRIHTLQIITPEGEKRFLFGGQKHGMHHVIDPGRKLGQHPILVAEGYATAASVHEALKLPVVVAFDSGNLTPVVQALHAKYPRQPILVLADDDHRQANNPGLRHGRMAAEAVRGLCLSPDFNHGEKERGLTDWNDLAASRGLEAVRHALTPALTRLERQQFVGMEK
ncbi:zincin-like metallopeptidase domain-containing protein [Nitratidesulfovibrio vulgaris]|uniref:zincin-like metallopeptidase domain-containing protein n=1 Tax=Nitratidesulfovibrio vulgaris TaxID=881 RepID=UPI002301C21F|nr:zincin-like metallopeptidase domain-containing protein [Nitratidesulfovibrio vulgaris]WCB46506.1 zincin-like metallopeptidase domain-containing protein [Nitratidesulfovibrio vulgaris]